MSYKAVIFWDRLPNEEFIDNRYSRKHSWTFDGGIAVPASSSPYVVPTPMSAVEAIDPEEAFVASLASCHMLFFLSVAAARGHVVESYSDEAVGTMAKDDEGRCFLGSVALNPIVMFASRSEPDRLALEKIHQIAHDKCFLANSVRTKIEISIKENK